MKKRKRKWSNRCAERESINRTKKSHFLQKGLFEFYALFYYYCLFLKVIFFRENMQKCVIFFSFEETIWLVHVGLVRTNGKKVKVKKWSSCSFLTFYITLIIIHSSSLNGPFMIIRSNAANDRHLLVSINRRKLYICRVKIMNYDGKCEYS